MKKCPKCGLQHQKFGIFCSRSCANSRKFSAAARSKKSIANKIARLNETEEQKRTRITKAQNTHQIKYPLSLCIVCQKNINKRNKHKMCWDCFIISDLALETRAQYNKNYHKEYVHDSNGDIVRLLSSYEYAYFQYLRKNNILWRKPDILYYFLDGKRRQYRPDFYLIATNEIIEIKGYWWPKDKYKMHLVKEHNPELNIKILEKRDLIQNGIIEGKSIRADTSL